MYLQQAQVTCHKLGSKMKNYQQRYPQATKNPAISGGVHLHSSLYVTGCKKLRSETVHLQAVRVSIMVSCSQILSNDSINHQIPYCRETTITLVNRLFGNHYQNATLPVLTSYMAPTIAISPLSSISRSTTLLSRSFCMVSLTFISVTAWTNSVFFELLGL